MAWAIPLKAGAGFRARLNCRGLIILLVNAPDEYYGGYSWFEYPGEIAPGIHRSRNFCLNCWTI